jgi:hypothetical protein
MLPAFLKEAVSVALSQLLFATQLPANALIRRISFATVGFSEYFSMAFKICTTSGAMEMMKPYHESSSNGQY